MMRAAGNLQRTDNQKSSFSITPTSRKSVKCSLVFYELATITANHGR